MRMVALVRGAGGAAYSQQKRRLCLLVDDRKLIVRHFVF